MSRLKKEFITNDFKQTQKLGELLAMELKGGEVICMEGDLGSGKTTFTQGLLKGLKIKGPYTSPTFVVMKEYTREISNSKKQKSNKFQISNKIENSKSQIQNIYHIDAYRINERDLQNLGWEEIIANKNNVVIVEWSERVKKILPKNVLKIKFEWVDENRRKITFV